jgi:hypothetical protein
MRSYQFPLMILIFILALAIRTHISNSIDQSSMVSIDKFAYQNPQNEIFHGSLTGQVTDRNTGLPIKGAEVDLSNLDLSTISDSEGRFHWQDLALPEAITPLTITINANGYGQWQLQDAKLVDSDTLILSSRLSTQPYNDRVSTSTGSHRDKLMSNDLGDLLPNDITSHSSTSPLPSFIRVRVAGYPYHCDTTRTYTVETIDFRQYAKHVLPNEWNYTWPADSLQAGAMAVKMYAWYWIALGGKWKDADVWDSTCDQVYNPNFEYVSTNLAVDLTWNWVLSRSQLLMPTFYRSLFSQCEDSGLTGDCMGQVESKDMALEGTKWDEILLFFYHNTAISPVTLKPLLGFMLRYNGASGDENENRILIPIDNPETSDPGPPVDVGSQDFTIEWWIKTRPSDNVAPEVACGKNTNWMFGNIILDSYVEDSNTGFGISLSDGHLIFGVSEKNNGNLSICGNKDIRDGNWHHIAIERRRLDGYLWLFVDGQLETMADGPDGDISYPDDAQAANQTDPFISISAWKLDTHHDLHPFFRGWIDEMRFSNLLRYHMDFIKPLDTFNPDTKTVTLYHFDEGMGNLISDSSNSIGGPSHGIRKYGGSLNGPEWVMSDLFHKSFIPLISK